MSDRKPADNHDPITMEIDREFERELSEMFHRTVPLIPAFNLEPTARVFEHRSLLRRTPLFMRVAVSLAAVVMLVTFAAIWQPSEAGANVSFAEVQERVEKTKTLTYRETTVTNGSGSREEQTETEKISLLAPSIVRFDKANGAYSLLDIGERRSLYVDPEKKHVTLFEGMGQITAEMQKMNLYDFFRGIQARAVSNLPAKTLDGKRCPGFLVKHEVEHPWSEEKLAIELNVWVDPESKLPVRIEEQRRYKEDDQEISAQVVMDQFVFDAPLDPKLFSFDPPEGYQVKSYGTAKLSAPHEDDEIQKPVLTPNVGLGPVKFGMLVDEVKKLLGEPDKENPIGNNGVTLDYDSRGYGMQVNNVLGVWLISASSPTFSAVRFREFAGQTEKGIGLGASEEVVRKAYGEPSRVEDRQAVGGLKTLNYDDLNGWFSFSGGKLKSMTFMIPRETKLKMFELRKPVLTPNVGLGPVKFGMLVDEVKKLLGEPDKENPIGENGVTLEYHSRGYGLNVVNVLGVRTINVNSPIFSAVRNREFVGQTEKGIGLGASEEDVRQAYGEPSSIEDDTDQGGYKTLYYNDLNGWFSFWRGKLDSMTFNMPRETKLKMFELRKPEEKKPE